METALFSRKVAASAGRREFIEVEEGVKLHVTDIGDGQPIVLIHGWPLSDAMFEYQYQSLAKKGFRVVGITLRGFGQSDKPYGRYDFDVFSDDIKIVLEQLNIHGAVLGGFSMGGAVVIHYVTKYNAAHISKLALFAAAAPSWVRRDDFPYGIPKADVEGIIDGTLTRRQDLIESFGAAFPAKEGGISKNVEKWLENINLQAEPYALTQSIIALRDLDLRPVLSEIEIPVVIFNGIHDKLCSFEVAEQLQKGIRNSNLVRFENSGHALFVEEAEKFNNELEKFARHEDHHLRLFKPYNLGTVNVSNRIVMAPMTRSRADNSELAATDLHAKYYRQRASAGLIISEGTTISKIANGYINVPGIYTAAQIKGWKLSTDAVHEVGGKIFAQLWHVGRISHPNLLGGRLPLAPSAINPDFFAYTPNGKEDTVVPKMMSIKDIKQTIAEYQQAAENAMQAGFDGVEIHAANGYLINQFFAKCANNRTDQYGGSIENRARFLFEILDKISERIDLSKVGVRISPTLTNTHGIVIDDETEATYEYICNKLNDYPVAYLHISGFSYDSVDPQSFILEAAKHYRKIYRGNYIINGGFDVKSASVALGNNVADLVSFGKPFISNPDLVTRFRLNAPLNAIDSDSIYTPGPKGYIDYPALSLG